MNEDLYDKALNAMVMEDWEELMSFLKREDFTPEMLEQLLTEDRD